MTAKGSAISIRIAWAEANKPRGPLAAAIAPLMVLPLLGAVSIAYPQLLGNGKDAVQLAYSDQFPVSLLLILPVLKLLATCGCLRSGAAGGLFTPTMTVGAILGGLLGHAWDCIWPGASMGSCSVISSCAFLAAATQGPISSLVLVLELTRHVDATMVPMLLAVVGSMLVARQMEARSIYSMRFHPIASRTEIDIPCQFPELEGVHSRPIARISAAMGFAQVAQILLSAKFNPPLYVIDHEGLPVGTIDEESLTPAKLGSMPPDAAKAADIAVDAPSVPRSK